MLLDLLREIEDQNTKLGSSLERHDVTQARAHHLQIRSLVIEAAVLLLRTDPESAQGLATGGPV